MMGFAFAYPSYEGTTIERGSLAAAEEARDAALRLWMRDLRTVPRVAQHERMGGKGAVPDLCPPGTPPRSGAKVGRSFVEHSDRSRAQ